LKEGLEVDYRFNLVVNSFAVENIEPYAIDIGVGEFGKITEVRIVLDKACLFLIMDELLYSVNPVETCIESFEVVTSYVNALEILIVEL